MEKCYHSEQPGLILHNLGPQCKTLRLWYRKIWLYCYHTISNHCLEFKSEQSDALSFAELPVHYKIRFCLFPETLSSSMFCSSELWLSSANKKVQQGHKMNSVDNLGQCRWLPLLVVACISDESDQSSGLTVHCQFLSGEADYWWLLLLDET